MILAETTIVALGIALFFAIFFGFVIYKVNSNMLKNQRRREEAIASYNRRREERSKIMNAVKQKNPTVRSDSSHATGTQKSGMKETMSNSHCDTFGWGGRDTYSPSTSSSSGCSGSHSSSSSSDSYSSSDSCSSSSSYD